MKISLFTLALLFTFAFSSFSQEQYDESLATKLGADDYGMRKYVMAFLLRGDRVSEYGETERADIQAGHMANISRMAEMGKLIVAGPFFGNDELRGIYIFDVQTIEEAKALTETDPAIKAGVLKMDLKEWYGSAALMMLPEIYPKVTKKSF
ncbi:YciI family protein [Algoriphagus litoralis]|uniref:YciI family protein n=1 Tax=Algoriphagus litoralis TaxID=2202829 RepID=UPI000DB9D5C0|nr:YciI family protein [Algoriphagus litoralis]